MPTNFKWWIRVRTFLIICPAAVLAIGAGLDAGQVPKVPRFSIDYMDKAVEPGDDFFRYACGSWVKNNPIPSDKARWAGFEELRERNWNLIHDILDASLAAQAPVNSSARQVGDFFTSAMDTNRIEQLRFKPLEKDFARIAGLKSVDEMLRLLAELQMRDVGAMFGASVRPDAKNSAVYAFYLGQGGLGLPDRDYYLSDNFAKQRDAYVAHIRKMLIMLGDNEADATTQAATVLELETKLAQASKSRAGIARSYRQLP
jgi:putative endopeptidase